MPSLDSLKTREPLTVGTASYDYFSLKAAAKTLGDISKLPFSLKVLLENLLRNENGTTVTIDDIKAVATWLDTKSSTREIAFRPARVLMQDFTGVPAVVDLAAMRDAMSAMGGDPQKINPLSPVDLVIDHSVIVDHFGSKSACKENVTLEYERNGERYKFLRWGQQAFDNFRVVPPGTGICHQVNLEYLAQTVWTAKEGPVNVAYPDTLVGTDSHTTMVNSLSVLGWGVGGIEAEAAMLGQPISMLIPEVVGFKLKGVFKEGTTATDLVLTITQMLRKHGVVGKFVEFHGPGLDALTLADRATIANMAPEYGATCGFFPIDQETIRFLTTTGRQPSRVALVEEYAKAQGIWRTADTPDPVFSSTLELDISTVESSLAGPKRPQDRVALSAISENFLNELSTSFGKAEASEPQVVEGGDYEVDHGHVVIAAITSCTNTSNPGVMLGAGLLARNAVAAGLKVKPWVKTSLAPGSKVVTDYFAKAGVDKALDTLGFNTVGYGCTTCIGNSGPLPKPVAEAVTKGDLVAGAVISGNRNFEGRVNPLVKANYLGSPMLVVAYAIAGSLKINITKDPIGTGKDGNPVYLKDIWPSSTDINDTIAKCVTATQFREQYDDVFSGDTFWKQVKTVESETYQWDKASTYIQNPPYFENMPATPATLEDVTSARILAILGDSITTDHISPAGSIKTDGPAGKFLIKAKVASEDFNQFGARRGNHEVMMRGTFANIRIKNELAPGTEGGVTKFFGKPGATIEDGAIESIYDVAMQYQKANVPLVVVAGKEYGTGSSRDWAAKGTNLLGVKAVIAESFERIHRSNLVGMGVLPLTFKDGADRKSISFEGTDTIDIVGYAEKLTPRMDVTCRITKADGTVREIQLLCRIDTVDEVEYFKNGGILHYVLRSLLKPAA